MKPLTLFAIALAATTVLGWFGRFSSWLELLTNAAPQMWFLGLVLVAWSVVVRNLVAATAGLAVVVWFTAVLAPFWFPTQQSDGRGATDDAARYTALQYNVYFGNDDVEAIASELQAADADIVTLHEVTTNQWAALQPHLTEYPHRMAEPWDGDESHQLGGGMALLSRTPLTPIDLDPAADVVGRPILAAATDLEGHQLVMVGLHPHASRFESHKVDLRRQQLEAVVTLLSGVDQPAIVMADLNITPTSPDYKHFVRDLGWEDPHRTTGWNATWPSWAGPLGVPIDHVLVSNAVTLHDAETSAGGGSDHRSVTAEFSLKESAD